MRVKRGVHRVMFRTRVSEPKVRQAEACRRSLLRLLHALRDRLDAQLTAHPRDTLHNGLVDMLPVDVSDPYNAVFYSEVPLPGYGSTYDIKLTSKYAYLAYQGVGIEVLDRTDPGNPFDEQSTLLFKQTAAECDEREESPEEKVNLADPI